MKKEKPETVAEVPVRLLDLYDGKYYKDMALWRVPLTHLREQDKNARIMEVEMFDGLSKNIEKNKNLESFPLTVLLKPEKKGSEFIFSIISGHHRTRAARAAGMTSIIVIVYEKNLSQGVIAAKQLGHNEYSGYDDPQLKHEIYLQINTIDAKMESGVHDFEFKMDVSAPKINDITISLDYEVLNILFLPRQTKELEKIFDQLEPEAKKYIADKKDFEKIADQMRDISKIDNIRNVSAIVSRMIEIVDIHLKGIKSKDTIKKMDAAKEEKKKKDNAKRSAKKK